MTGQTYSVTFTTGVIEKVAGIKKPPKETRDGGPLGLGPSGRPFTPEVALKLRQDAELGRALQSSRKVGGLLLKQEEEELQRIDGYATELLKKYNYAPKAPPCQAERDACVSCYSTNPQDPLKCAAAVDAYQRCAAGAFESFVRRTGSAAR